MINLKTRTATVEDVIAIAASSGLALCPADISSITRQARQNFHLAIFRTNGRLHFAPFDERSLGLCAEPGSHKNRYGTLLLTTVDRTKPARVRFALAQSLHHIKATRNDQSPNQWPVDFRNAEGKLVRVSEQKPLKRRMAQAQIYMRHVAVEVKQAQKALDEARIAEKKAKAAQTQAKKAEREAKKAETISRKKRDTKRRAEAKAAREQAKVTKQAEREAQKLAKAAKNKAKKECREVEKARKTAERERAKIFARAKKNHDNMVKQGLRYRKEAEKLKTKGDRSGAEIALDMAHQFGVNSAREAGFLRELKQKAPKVPKPTIARSKPLAAKDRVQKSMFGVAEMTEAEREKEQFKADQKAFETEYSRAQTIVKKAKMAMPAMRLAIADSLAAIGEDLRAKLRSLQKRGLTGTLPIQKVQRVEAQAKRIAKDAQEVA